MNARKIVSTALAVTLGASVLVTGCGSIDPDATLITINDGEDTISLGYANFVARYQQSLYDQYLMSYYGETMWSSDMSGDGSTFEETVKTDLLDAFEEQYLCKKHAADYDVELTDDDNDAIKEAVTEFFDTNPDDTIEVMGATEDYLTTYLEYRTYASMVKSAVEESADVEVTDDECWERTFSYVLLSTSSTTDSDGNTVELTDDEITALKTEAEKLSAAEDYDAEAETLGLDVQTASYLKGEEEDDTFDMSVITAAEALSEGQVSDVIEVEDKGYYVLRLDSDHDEDASETERETLLEEKQSDFYDETLQSWKDETTWEVDEKAWAKVKFDTLFSTLETEDDSTDETESTDETTDTTEETTDETTEESTEETTDETSDVTEDTESTDETSEETTEETTEDSEETTEDTTTEESSETSGN